MNDENLDFLLKCFLPVEENSFKARILEFARIILGL